jgi:hypothetical protein
MVVVLLVPCLLVDWTVPIPLAVIRLDHGALAVEEVVVVVAAVLVPIDTSRYSCIL